MSYHNDLGKKGEVSAKTYLIGQDYKIIGENWQHEKAEIDLIVFKEGLTIFIEVKTRTSNNYGFPETAVTKTKQKHLLRAAEAFIEQKNIITEIRFDIISLTKIGEVFTIYHIKDAFFPSAI